MATIKTVGEWLDGLGGRGRVLPYSTELFDVETEAPVLGGSEGSGFLQGYCDGDIILSLRPTNPCRRTVYMVRNVTAHNMWKSKAKQVGLNRTIRREGPCPHAKLMLVQSA